MLTIYVEVTKLTLTEWLQFIKKNVVPSLTFMTFFCLLVS